MAYGSEDDEEQLAFDFYDNTAEEKAGGNPAERDVTELLEKIDFETEEDALAALTGKIPLVEEEDSWESPSSGSGGMCECMVPAESGTSAENAADISGMSGKPSRENASPEEETDMDAPPWDVPGSSSSPAQALSCENAEKTQPPCVEKSPMPFNKAELRRAALGFLSSLRPSGAAMHVPVQSGRLRADAAAFWLPAGCRTDVLPLRTATAWIVPSRNAFQQMSVCPDALRSDLEKEMRRKEELEGVIRRKEPFVREASLFQEDAKWDYSKSGNRFYHACLRRIEKLQAKIDAASFYTFLLSRELSDQYFLICPESVVQAEEVPAGWGLVWIGQNLNSTLVRDAEIHAVSMERRTALALRIASCSFAGQLFANGIDAADSGKVFFRPVPRRRRPYSAD